jgi:hypothetical protein
VCACRRGGISPEVAEARLLERFVHAAPPVSLPLTARATAMGPRPQEREQAGSDTSTMYILQLKLPG